VTISREAYKTETGRREKKEVGDRTEFPPNEILSRRSAKEESP